MSMTQLLGLWRDIEDLRAMVKRLSKGHLYRMDNRLRCNWCGNDVDRGGEGHGRRCAVHQSLALLKRTVPKK